jgi:hypothetical protein
MQQEEQDGIKIPEMFLGDSYGLIILYLRKYKRLLREYYLT